VSLDAAIDLAGVYVADAPSSLNARARSNLLSSSAVRNKESLGMKNRNIKNSMLLRNNIATTFCSFLHLEQYVYSLHISSFFIFTSPRLKKYIYDLTPINEPNIFPIVHNFRKKMKKTIFMTYGFLRIIGFKRFFYSSFFLFRS